MPRGSDSKAALICRGCDTALSSAPLPAASGHELADTLFDTGRYAEAEIELREAAITEARLLGADHPAPLATQSKAAACLLLQGRVTAARAELNALLPRMENNLRADADSVLMARMNLAHANKLLGNPTAASLELHRVLRLCEGNTDRLKEIASTAREMLRLL